MRINVQGGTPLSGERSLCKNCRLGVTMSGENREEYTFCRYTERGVPFRITNCSQFDDKSTTSVHEMEKIAWKLCADKKGNTAGFLSPGDYVEKRSKGIVRKFDPDDFEPFAGEA